MAKQVQFKDPGTTGSAGVSPSYEQLQEQIATLLQESEARVNDLNQARAVLRKTHDWVIDAVEEHIEQGWALACTLSNKLRPLDPKNPTDDERILEWRLAELLEAHLSSGEPLHCVRAMLLGESK